MSPMRKAVSAVIGSAVRNISIAAACPINRGSL